MTDVNALFAGAERDFTAGRLDAALAGLERVQRHAAEHPQVLHLRALVQRRRGDLSDAARAFDAAVRLAPHDAQIRNNHANFLGGTGAFDAALAQYDAAIAIRPDFAQARLNRALLLQRMERHSEALAEFENLVRLSPGSVTAHSAKGASLRALERLDEAAQAYGHALALAPDHPKALLGRARVALERGERGAAVRYRIALARAPDADREDALLGLAEALQAESDREGSELLGVAVAAAPHWITGQDRLAQMRAEAGEGDAFARGYDEALTAMPDNRELHLAKVRILSRAGHHGQALKAIRIARARVGNMPDLDFLEGALLSETGDLARAADVLTRLPDTYEARMARARHHLRAGEVRQVTHLLEGCARERPDDITAWAYLGLAWRLAGDSRHDWLCGQPGLTRMLDLPVGVDELEALAGILRALHTTRAHPVGQSLRGGTQTRGRLFWRAEPELRALRSRMQDALATYAESLPARDDTHPLLRHRDDTLRIGGSWSVRLSRSGFHVHHIHPEGVLSSAFYVALPTSLGGANGREGWLELGASPKELGLGLEALHIVEPKPGRLALFPSYLYHGTRRFAEGERLTVAFDVVASA